MRTENGLSSEGFCNLPGIAQWKLDFMLTCIVNELWEAPQKTVKKLLSIVLDACEDISDNE